MTAFDDLRADVKRVLTGYAKLVDHDGYLNAEVLTGSLEWLIRDAANWREAEAEGHVVKFTATGYGLQHPPSCRPNLIGCKFNRHLNDLNNIPVRPGRYRMTRDEGGWQYTRLPAKAS